MLGHVIAIILCAHSNHWFGGNFSIAYHIINTSFAELEVLVKISAVFTVEFYIMPSHVIVIAIY